MLRIHVSTAEAVIQETELITAGRKGLKCSFTFNEAWEGLARTVVFMGAATRDVALLATNEVTVPAECIAKAHFPLKIGVYGSNGDGTIAIPTIWVSFGKVLPGASRSWIDPEELTPDLVAQIQEAANNALYLAQNVQGKADSGEFDGADGVSPVISSSSISGGHRLTIVDADGTSTVDVMDGATGPEGPEGPAGADGADGADGVGVPAGGTTGQVLKKASGTDYDTEWATVSGGGAFWATYGTTSFADIMAAHNAGDAVFAKEAGMIYALDYIAAHYVTFTAVTTSANSAYGYTLKVTDANVWSMDSNRLALKSDSDAKYTKPSGGIPATDLASAVQTSLGKADTALQSAPVTSVNGSTGAVTLSIPSTAGDVGAIPAPASPSSGDVLTYDGSTWGAAAPAHQIPAGGNAGECLAKNSATNYDLRWRTINDWTPAGLMRTAGGTAAKVAEWSFWSDAQDPAWLVVTVGNSNTYAGAITLKVNGKGPYPIYINGAASSATNYTLPAGSYFVYFDGTKFDFRTDGKIPGGITGHADQDIAAPGSPSSGDFLRWTGSAWAAQSIGPSIQDAVDDYLDDHPTVTGTFTNEAKYALLALLEKVAYIDENGQSYLDALETQLFAATVTSISAVFTQGANVIYETDSLDTLKQYLVVTATYSDSTTATVTTYTLSGTLTAGTSTITVSYGGKTTTFTATVTAWDFEWDYTMGTPIGNGFAHSSAVTGTMRNNGYQITGTSSGGCNIITDPSTAADSGVTEIVICPTSYGNVYTDGAVRIDVKKLFGLALCENKMYYSNGAWNSTDFVDVGSSQVNTDYTIRLQWNVATGATCWVNGENIYTISGPLNADRTRWFITATTANASAIVKAMRVKVVS